MLFHRASSAFRWYIHKQVAQLPRVFWTFNSVRVDEFARQGLLRTDNQGGVLIGCHRQYPAPPARNSDCFIILDFGFPFYDRDF